VYEATVDSPSVDEPVTVNVPPANGRIQSVPEPSSYALLDRLLKASVLPYATLVSSFAVALTLDELELPTLSDAVSR